MLTTTSISLILVLNLQVDPEKRATAQECLSHPWLTSGFGVFNSDHRQRRRDQANAQSNDLKFSEDDDGDYDLDDDEEEVEEEEEDYLMAVAEEKQSYTRK